MAKVQHAWHDRAECLAVLDHSRQRGAAHVDAVIGALARNQVCALSFLMGEMVGEGDLDRRIDGLGAGIAEKDVIQVLRRQLRNRIRQFKRAGVAAQERRREIQRLQLLAYRFGDFGPAMSGRCCEQSGASVQDLAAVLAPVVHAAGLDEHPGRALELAIVGERHPMLFERCFSQFHVVLRDPVLTWIYPNVDPISAAAACSCGTNSIALISGSLAVAPCTATAATISPCRLRTGTATHATPSTYSSLSTA